MRAHFLTLGLLAAALLTSCASGGSGSSEPPPEWNAAGEVRETTNRRVVYYDPSGTALILVNEGNPWRKTPEGQARLALWDLVPGARERSQGYKVLSEANMQALLQALENKGLGRLATPFEPGDEDLFTRGRTQGYRGIVYVEDGDRRVKAEGYKPNGAADAVGRDRFVVFNELRLTVLYMHSSVTLSETPRFRLR